MYKETLFMVFMYSFFRKYTNKSQKNNSELKKDLFVFWISRTTIFAFILL